MILWSRKVRSLWPRTGLRGHTWSFAGPEGGGERMTGEGSHYEYYQLRAMLEWDLADRAPDMARRDRHRVEAEKFQLLAQAAKQGMMKRRAG